ncbi:hypothetical protein J6590_055616 [Homalodisca vitripennis]|nr:hypothetical protein J6590_055616 [Homalodisca vitripennis]
MLPGSCLGPMRLVSIPKANTSEESMFLSRAATYKAAEPEVTQMFKYGLRQVEVFLSSHGLSLPLGGLGVGGPSLVYDDGSNTIGDARGIHSKKKLAILFPMMVLIKFGIIKAILIPILLTLLFIKKVLILGVMALPSILSTLKACKIVSPYHAHAAYHSYAPVVGVTGSDYSPEFTSYAAQGYDSYGKDWSSNQRRTRWGKASPPYFSPDSVDNTNYQQTEQTSA